MQLGMIGLGRMGASMVRRLMKHGHGCVVHDTRPEAVAALHAEGADGTASIKAFMAKLSRPRTVWLMVPAAIARQSARPAAAARSRRLNRAFCIAAHRVQATSSRWSTTASSTA